MTRFGTPRRHFRSTDSTDARARELALAGGPGGLVVTADEQSAGRGRQGRSWFAPAGTALLYSALLRPLGERPLLPLAVPLAVCEAAESLAPVSCGVKWPNDVWIGERKLAGVLIESRAGDDGWAVIGVGMNVAVPPDAFPAELRETATSLTQHTRGLTPPGGKESQTDASSVTFGVAQARDALDERLAEWVSAPAERILAAFRERDALAGRRVAWDEGEGAVAGIDDSGHLLVDDERRGRVTLGAGEVHLALPDHGA